MSKWNNKPEKEEDKQDDWMITPKMVRTFHKEWEELGSADAVLEKYGAAKCEEIKIPDDILPHIPLAGKLKGRTRRRAIAYLTYEYENKKTYYEKYIRISPYSDNDSNIFQDWEIPARFFKRIQERAEQIRTKEAIAEKKEKSRLQIIANQQTV